jgi:zinc transport system substrate-binding protein
MVILAAVMLVSVFACRGGENAGPGRQGVKLKVVASLFPTYDFARAVGGEYAEVSLLLPPGVEPHSFEPRPADMAALNNADIFIYTNRYMEPWVEGLLKGTDRGRLLIVDAGRGTDFLEQEGAGSGHEERKTYGHEPEHGPDPHIWLDFGNAKKMVGTIGEAFISRDPAHRDIYMKNAEAYRTRLDMLDRKYREALSGCRKKTMVDGGHYTFGYLAARYGLKYQAAYGLSPEAEPTARDLARISTVLRQEGLTHLFHEELLSPRIAETIAHETGASLLRLHGAHNVSREELKAGTTFIDLMEKNLEQLLTGLQCR